MMPVSVVVTRYREPNEVFHALLRALSSQKNAHIQAVILDQVDDRSTEELCKKLSNDNVRFEYSFFEARNLSHARTEGFRRARYDKILITDSDGVPAENWAYEMSNALNDPRVAIVGSRIFPKWLRKPNILTRSNIVIDQYSLLNLGDKELENAKAIGVSFGLDRGKIKEETYMDEKISRRNGLLLSGDETDLWTRVLKKGLISKYIPSTFVYHQISKERCRVQWTLKRLFYAGVTRRQCGGFPRPTHKRNFYDFLFAPIILPVYFAGYIGQKILFRLKRINQQ